MRRAVLMCLSSLRHAVVSVRFDMKVGDAVCDERRNVAGRKQWQVVAGL